MPNFLRPVPGDWYYTVTCRECALPIRFFPDETKGNLQISVQKTLPIQCPRCQVTENYHTSEMTSTQEPETKGRHVSA